MSLLSKLKTLAAHGRNALADLAEQTGSITVGLGPASVTVYPRTAVVQTQPPAAPVPCEQAPAGPRLCIRCARRHA